MGRFFCLGEGERSRICANKPKQAKQMAYIPRHNVPQHTPRTAPTGPVTLPGGRNNPYSTAAPGTLFHDRTGMPVTGGSRHTAPRAPQGSAAGTSVRDSAKLIGPTYQAPTTGGGVQSRGVGRAGVSATPQPIVNPSRVPMSAGTGGFNRDRFGKPNPYNRGPRNATGGGPPIASFNDGPGDPSRWSVAPRTQEEAQTITNDDPTAPWSA